MPSDPKRVRQVLQGAVDWSGVTNRDQAHILLAEIDPGKITDVQRNKLIDLAAAAGAGSGRTRQGGHEPVEGSGPEDGAVMSC